MSDDIRKWDLDVGFSIVAMNYVLWSEAEQQASAATIVHRQSCLRQVVRIVGEKPPTHLTKDDLLFLKRTLIRRNLGPSRQAGILNALKNLLVYCRDELHLPLSLQPEDISFP